MSTILVTGGAGFIGSHTCVELLNAGFSLVVMDNFCNSKPDCIEKIKQITSLDFKFYEADMLDFSSLCKIFEQNKIDAVVHFAGLKAVGESVEKPQLYYHNNICGTLEIVRAMQKYGCKTMVFSSSATVYGFENPSPYKEEYKTSATSPYGYTKLMVEQILADISVSDDDFCSVSLRYFNPIGAHESGLIGENPNGIPNNLIPYIAKVAKGELAELSVYGDDYETEDGTGVRDYIHVVDLAKGHLKAIDFALKSTGAHAINLGTGMGSSVLDVIKSFEKASGISIKRRVAPRRAGDIASYFANTAKAKETLGFVATKTLDQMCEDSWKFAKNNN